VPEVGAVTLSAVHCRPRLGSRLLVSCHVPLGTGMGPGRESGARFTIHEGEQCRSRFVRVFRDPMA